MIGTIKRLMEKGFGFIESADLMKEKIQGDIFFHFSALEGGIETFDSLKEGQKVSFEIASKKDGKKQAVDVVVLSNAAAAALPSNGMADNYDEEEDRMAA